MTRSVEGMSALVTGGGSGIGAAVVARLAAAGARVTVSGRRPDRVRAVADAAGPAVLAVAGDVTDARDRQRMVDAAVEHGDGLELLVHGAANMYRGALEELDEEQLVEVFTSNTIAPMLLTGLALPHLRERRGAVVFFGSVHTQRAFPGASPYAATKGALETLTRCARRRVGAARRAGGLRPTGRRPHRDQPTSGPLRRRRGCRADARPRRGARARPQRNAR